MLPSELGEREFRDEVTGAQIRPARANGTSWIFIGEALQSMPVAMLRAI
jgi:hypothetical protein